MGAEVSLIVPKSHGEPGHVGSAERRGLGRGGALDGDSQNVRLELTEKIVASGATVHT